MDLVDGVNRARIFHQVNMNFVIFVQNVDFVDIYSHGA